MLREAIESIDLSDEGLDQGTALVPGRNDWIWDAFWKWSISGVLPVCP